MTRCLRILRFVTLLALTIVWFSSCFAQEKSRRSPTLDELLLFFPSKFPEGNWEPAGLQFEDVRFEAADKTQLHGWYCPCDSPRAVILMAHGNAGNVSSRADWLKYLQTTARVSVLMFDYRGYGRSEGVSTVEGVLLDARAARGKLCELAAVKESELLLMGESLGGAVVVQLAAESAPRGLIVQSSFSSMKEVAKFHYPRLSWLVPASKLDSRSAMARYAGPLLQSHGTADEVIPFSSGEKLYWAATGQKEFVKIPGAGHNNWLNPQYLNRLDAFIDRVAQDRKTAATAN